VAGRVLVAGIGNMFLGDDGFGPEVVRRLEREGGLPGEVRVADYGIRGMHLAYDLLDPVDALILVDTVAAGDRPGEITVLEVGPADLAGGNPAGRDPAGGNPAEGDPADGNADGNPAGVDAHGMNPATMLAGLGRMGGALPPTYVVGCRPSTVDEGIGLSAAVEAAVSPAIAAIREVVARLVPAGRR
jgi:hydrogenase maturation protease